MGFKLILKSKVYKLITINKDAIRSNKEIIIYKTKLLFIKIL